MTQPGEMRPHFPTPLCACGTRIYLLFHLSCADCENRSRLLATAVSGRSGGSDG